MAKRILVVDDDADLLALLADALGDEGHIVVTCGRPRDAYQTTKTMKPDVILLDIKMPGMNGWEVLNVLLLDRALRAIPVLLMTAAPAEARRRLAKLDLHDVSVLDKPFTIDTLLSQVEHALGNPSECEVLYDRLMNGGLTAMGAPQLSLVPDYTQSQG